MGGSSLAPEVVTAAAGVPLTVLDSSDPTTVRAAVSDQLDRTVVVVSSKSGSTLETDSQRRAYERAFTEAGIDPVERIVVVTDPGSPLDGEARKTGYRVFNADPEVGGRYSALTAFGLVPSGLAGADIGALLDAAAAIAPDLAADSVGNPGLRLGSLLGLAAQRGVDKVVLADLGSGLPGFGDWAEQLIAESTGKNGTGILPVVVESPDVPTCRPSTADEVLTGIGPVSAADRLAPESGWGAVVDAPLGAQMLLWEYATVVAGRVLGINPFDQPDVESAKSAARGLLENSAPAAPAAFTEGAVEGRATDGLLSAGTDSIAAAVEALLSQLDPDAGYLAVMAYLDRGSDARLAEVRVPLAERTGRPTTFGWGPRFLHSTGQYHKGGPGTGVYLQVTGEAAEDLSVPGRDYTFGEFLSAQAAGDAQVLAEHGRPVLRLHLLDRKGGLDQLLRALR
jgi:glucose-6-phosphate isomerase